MIYCGSLSSAQKYQSPFAKPQPQKWYMPSASQLTPKQKPVSGVWVSSASQRKK